MTGEIVDDYPWFFSYQCCPSCGDYSRCPWRCVHCGHRLEGRAETTGRHEI